MFSKTFSRFFRSAALTHGRHFHKYSSVLEAHTEDIEEATITVKGWVKSLRVQKKNCFIDINDGSCNQKLQIVIPTENKPENLTWGSSIVASGKLAMHKKGQLELQADLMEVIKDCVVTDGYPFTPRQALPPQYIRQFMHFRPKTDYIASMLRVRDTATRSVHDYFASLGYIGIHAPVLTSNDCEGAGQLFTVEPNKQETLQAMQKEGVDPKDAYFNTKTFLTVSGQLHLEAAANALSKVYSFGPTFRAENSKSRLHLSEFYMIEAEFAFTDDLNDVKRLVENLVKYTTNDVLTRCSADVKNLRGCNDVEVSWLNEDFKSLTYEEAFDLLKKNENKFETPLNKDEAFAKEHELVLVQLMDGVPTFVTDWPKEMKPFYMRQCGHDPTKVAALDLLAPITGEIAGGSLREDNYDLLSAKLPSPSLDWYLQLRKFGGAPTGGFGLGFERLLQLICHIANIKDAIPFPRWPHNCSM